MLGYIWGWIQWASVRAIITLATVFTIHRMILTLGYRSDFTVLLVITALSIFTVRVWMPGKQNELF